jgi:hypothetical protein
MPQSTGAIAAKKSSERRAMITASWLCSGITGGCCSTSTILRRTSVTPSGGQSNPMITRGRPTMAASRDMVDALVTTTSAAFSMCG